MRFVLELKSGPMAGQRFWIRDDWQVKIGSTEWADYSIPGDPQMSPVHFQIESRDQRGLIQDLGSQHGTFVNETSVAEMRLTHGDVIRAGMTRFQVAIENTRVSSVQAAPPATGVRPLNTTPMQAISCSFEYRHVPTESGLTRYVCEDAGCSLTDLAKQLARTADTYVIGSASTLYRDPESQHLLVDDSAWQLVNGSSGGILLASVTSLGSHLGALDRLLPGTIALVQSSVEHSQFVGHLAQFSNSFSSPRILKGQLQLAQNEFVAEVLSGIGSVTIGAPEGIGWTMFCAPGRSWSNVGLPCPPLT